MGPVSHLLIKRLFLISLSIGAGSLLCAEDNGKFSCEFTTSGSTVERFELSGSQSSHTSYYNQSTNRYRYFICDLDGNGIYCAAYACVETSHSKDCTLLGAAQASLSTKAFGLQLPDQAITFCTAN